MKILNIAVCCVALVLGSGLAVADDAAKLIEMDKAWGEAKGPGDVKGLFHDEFISLEGNGPGDEEQALAAMAEAGSEDGPYVAGDYVVRFLGKKTAVMVHSAGVGTDAHWSMHVWKKSDGKWQVAATASVPAASEGN